MIMSCCDQKSHKVNLAGVNVGIKYSVLTTISNVKLSTKQIFSLLCRFLSDEDFVQVPFPELSGESVEYLEQTSEAILALSNFRLFIRFKDSFVNVSFYFVCCFLGCFC